MEQLTRALKVGINKLGKCHGKYDLSDTTPDNLYSVFPFNQLEYVICHLISENVLTLDNYLKLRNAYLERNKYLYLFEITAPRTFGETWAQRHLNELVPELKRPAKKYHDAYVGEYDFWYEGIRIEVKASRAVQRVSGGFLVNKALSSDSMLSFNMNFQQIKLMCCDVFVWLGVGRDTIRYWVFASYEVVSNKYFSQGQHRGNVGEGQLWIKDSNIREFERYLSEPSDILDKIKQKATDQKKKIKNYQANKF